jgi:hypothetical protein
MKKLFSLFSILLLTGCMQVPTDEPVVSPDSDTSYEDSMNPPVEEPVSLAEYFPHVDASDISNLENLTDEDFEAQYSMDKGTFFMVLQDPTTYEQYKADPASFDANALYPPVDPTMDPAVTPEMPVDPTMDPAVTPEMPVDPTMDPAVTPEMPVVTE